MNHLIMLPLLIPLVTGCLLLLGGRGGVPAARGLSLLSCVALLVVAGLLRADTAAGNIEVYTLGAWPPPFGIALVLDRLAALMLLATASLALPALMYAFTGADRAGRHFHALFQFQLFGLNGAFLTGDLFNLFVFFEVLLIASYGLLLHGGGSTRTRAGLHYVLLNLTGSALFLVAAGIFYGITGTLNLADLSVYVAQADPADAPLLAAAGLLLMVVFGLKAAVFPLHCWLPHSYAAATAPAAALFAVMSKVGIYALLRVSTLLFGPQAGALAGLLQPWLWPLALLTLAAGALGALQAATLQGLIAHLVVVSVGTLLAGLALDNVAATTATLYYLLHSTWVGGAMFLAADLVARRRGASGGRLVAGAPSPGTGWLGALFCVGAAALAGLPPLSGFIGKLLLLQAAPAAAPGATTAWLWSVVLGAGLLSLIALSRAGSTLFWHTAGTAPAARVAIAGSAVVAVCALLAGSLLLSALAGPVVADLGQTAAQLADPGNYTAAVLALSAPPGALP